MFFIRSDVSAMSDSDVGDQQMLITVSINFQNFVDVPFISTCGRYPVHERFPLSWRLVYEHDILPLKILLVRSRMELLCCKREHRQRLTQVTVLCATYGTDGSLAISISTVRPTRPHTISRYTTSARMVMSTTPPYHAVLTALGRLRQSAGQVRRTWFYNDSTTIRPFDDLRNDLNK